MSKMNRKELLQGLLDVFKYLDTQWVGLGGVMIPITQIGLSS